MKFLNQHKKSITVRSMSLLAAAGLFLASAGIVSAATIGKGKWFTSDFHQHTTYTDGSYSYGKMMEMNNTYGLDWWANSEHGGGTNRWGKYGMDNGGDVYWDSQPITILGNVSTSGGHQVMWRWQSLRDFAFEDYLDARALYPKKTLFQGLEWNVPGHEHCSVSTIAGQFDALDPNCKALAEFEYKFDKSDADTTGGAAQGWVKSALTNYHPKAVEAVTWLENNYPYTSWAVIAHPERQGPWVSGKTSTGYNIEHFRDLNNAGPDVCFGFESAPGHQAAPDRGGYSPATAFGGTFGGVGAYAATVGGLWDALLGEGRHWWLFANSDCHQHYTDGGEDFWPGEYQKNIIFTPDANLDNKFSSQEILDALRSGKSYVVFGDLINNLDYYIYTTSDVTKGAYMGDTLNVKKGSTITVIIRFKSPKVNNNGDRVSVDHVDLISGNVTGKAAPGTSEYTNATNSSTHVVATFDETNWTKKDPPGWYEMKIKIKNVQNSMYFRLRGTNLAPDTAYETDGAGNPLPDHLVTDNLGIDGADEAWRDLWFYTNPIFVNVMQ